MIQDYLKAGYPVLLVRTHEPERFPSTLLLRWLMAGTPINGMVRDFREWGGVAGERP